jgi:tetratricopeptide (TPR) repeat protein
MAEELLPLMLKVNGQEHPDTLAAMGNLAGSYTEAGHPDEALKMSEELLPLMRKVNGPEHPDTLKAMNNLAESYVVTGRPDAALKLGEELLALRRKVNGPEHPDTLKAMNNLAESYVVTGRPDAALKLREELLALRRKVNGLEHPDTLKVMNRLAVLYSNANRQDEAAALRDEAAAAKTKALPDVIASVVPPDSTWKWLHPIDGRDPAETTAGFHTAFFRPDFDDSKWKAGTDSADPNGGFGYGLNFTGLSIGKPEDMIHRRTAYFRHVFKTDKAHDHLELRCRRDDGIIVYLDGKEVVRDNLPAGPDAYQLSATRAQGPDNDGVIHRFPIPGTLAAGDHILAVSVHNTAQPSSDLYLGGVTLAETKPDASGEEK